MKNLNLSRRQFLESALYSSLIYATGALPKIIPTAQAAPSALQNRILVNLFLDGGPDMRHLIVPAFSSDPNSFGGKYWSNRTRSHNLADSGQTAQQRWNQDYYHITVGGSNWESGLADIGGLNQNVTFGIWKEAGWLIDMFRDGNVALIFNAVGGTNRAHDLSSLQLNQGNILSTLNEQDRSGWGGRLARSAGGNSISLSRTPSAFNFGPVGAAPNYNPNAIDNTDLISIQNSRNIGLFDFNLESNQHDNSDDKMARAAKSYYAGLRKEQVSAAYQKFMDHEFKSRQFGNAIENRLQNIPVPILINALRNAVPGINPDPNGDNDDRRVLHSRSFADQIRNLYDVIALNDLSVTVDGEALGLNPRTLSMEYGGWDSHNNQREIPSELAGNPGNGILPDPNNPFEDRGIENGLRDIFGGQFVGESALSPSDSGALHGGFSALWNSLNDPTLGVLGSDQIVLTVAGEFGRQIRDNDDNGTDHGKGNLMFVISEGVTGGIYGEMFPSSEIVKYDEPPNRTPDIDPRTEFDHFFAQVCDWVSPGTGTTVFPRMASGNQPMIERANMFDGLFG